MADLSRMFGGQMMVSEMIRKFYCQECGEGAATVSLVHVAGIRGRPGCGYAAGQGRWVTHGRQASFSEPSLPPTRAIALASPLSRFEGWNTPQR